MQWELVGYIAGLLTMFAFVPQIFKMYKTRSVNDISLPSFLQQFVGISLWFIYSLLIENKPMILSNTITLSSVIAIILLYFKHRKVK
jgi:MtN3 and saliva related transmembrane protein